MHRKPRVQSPGAICHYHANPLDRTAHPVLSSNRQCDSTEDLTFAKTRRNLILHPPL